MLRADISISLLQLYLGIWKLQIFSVRVNEILIINTYYIFSGEENDTYRRTSTNHLQNLDCRLNIVEKSYPLTTSKQSRQSVFRNHTTPFYCILHSLRFRFHFMIINKYKFKKQTNIKAVNYFKISYYILILLVNSSTYLINRVRSTARLVMKANEHITK